MRSTTQKLCAWLFVALLCYQCTAQKAGLQMLYMQHAQAAQLSVHSSGDVSLDLQGVQASLFFSGIKHIMRNNIDGTQHHTTRSPKPHCRVDPTHSHCFNGQPSCFGRQSNKRGSFWS